MINLRKAQESFKEYLKNYDIEDGNIIEKKLGDVLCPLGDIALYSYYDRINAKPITSDTQAHTLKPITLHSGHITRRAAAANT